MIVHTRTREYNPNGRCGCFVETGGNVAHIVEYVTKSVLLSTLEGHILETNNEPELYPDFVPRQVCARRSQIDGRVVVYLFGYDADTSNSRVLVIKLNTVV